MNLSTLQPERVFHYFSEISRIPHGSGNTEALRQYCADFAKAHDLPYVCDDAGNIIIRKPASAGYETSEPVILQGHLDMVCEKEESCTIDMDKEGLTLCCDDDYVFADGTTLGADDGIAIAYALAVLADDSLKHPPLEVLLTTDEEVGLLGANALDCSLLQGKRLINIDSEEEGIITVGCAGGVRCACAVAKEAELPADDAQFLKISVSGLRGGHSGIDIGKNRANATVLLARLLERLADTCNIRLCSINGGSKDNVIPKTAHAIIMTTADTALLNAQIAEFSAVLAQELHQETAVFHAEPCSGETTVLTEACMRKLLFILQHSPNGVVEMMPDMPGMVKTSLNMGVVKTTEDSVEIAYMLRSNTTAGREALEQRLTSFIRYMGETVTASAAYAPWEYRADSPLRDIFRQTFVEIYGKEPVIETIHAGLECAVFDRGIADADMVSFGPDIENAHTPQERLGIRSVEHCWKLLCKVLENLK